MEEKLKEFIKDNGLSFDDTGSALNSNFTIISGYACYLQAELIELIRVIDKIDLMSTEEIKELEKIYEYAKRNNYDKFWETELAKKQYKF